MLSYLCIRHTPTFSFSLVHPAVAVCAHADLSWGLLLMANLIVTTFFFLHLMPSFHLDSCLLCGEVILLSTHPWDH